MPGLAGHDGQKALTDDPDPAQRGTIKSQDLEHARASADRVCLIACVFPTACYNMVEVGRAARPFRLR